MARINDSSHTSHMNESCPLPTSHVTHQSAKVCQTSASHVTYQQPMSHACAQRHGQIALSHRLSFSNSLSLYLSPSFSLSSSLSFSLSRSLSISLSHTHTHSHSQEVMSHINKSWRAWCAQRKMSNRPHVPCANECYAIHR